MKIVKDNLKNNKPDLIVLVDYVEFNLKLQNMQNNLIFQYYFILRRKYGLGEKKNN